MQDIIAILFSKITAYVTMLFVFIGINGPIVYETPPPPEALPTSLIINPLQNTEKEVTEEIPASPPVSPSAQETTPPKEDAPTHAAIETTVSSPVQEIESSVEPLQLHTDQANSIDLHLLNLKVRDAVTNIFCLSKGSGFFEPASASGVVIDPRGVILTNAHVAQYFLIRDYPVSNNIDCIIRTGSPAQPAYRASLLYISQTWIEENRQNLVLSNPQGTGEHDYALLLIREPINPSKKMPEMFPFLSAASHNELHERGQNVFVGSYPAGFLGGLSITKGLWLITSTTFIKDIYTFHEDTADVYALGSVISTQEGSSGGAVVNALTGNLTGLITARTEGKTTDERELRALSLLYINDRLLAETGENLETFLHGDLLEKEENFRVNKAPQLKQILVNELEK